MTDKKILPLGNNDDRIDATWFWHFSVIHVHTGWGAGTTENKALLSSTRVLPTGVVTLNYVLDTEFFLWTLRLLHTEHSLTLKRFFGLSAYLIENTQLGNNFYRGKQRATQ
jgi:hypothetical protein